VSTQQTHNDNKKYFLKYADVNIIVKIVQYCLFLCFREILVLPASREMVDQKESL